MYGIAILAIILGAIGAPVSCFFGALVNSKGTFLTALVCFLASICSLIWAITYLVTHR